jgi:cyclic pyranopterin phosphate synthase
MIDPFGRHISYLRVSVTDRCDFRCVYCMAEEMTFLPKSEVLTLEELDRLCSAFVRLGVKKLRITGGEPLVRKNVMSLFESLSRHLKTQVLDELTLTTNGSQLAQHAHRLAELGVKRVNVSIDTLDSAKFTEITRRGKLEQVLEGAFAARDAGLKVKVNTVALRGVNEDEMDDLVAWCGKQGFDLCLIETMPLGDIDGDRTNQYLPLSLVRSRLAARWTRPVPTSASSRPSLITSANPATGSASPAPARCSCASARRMPRTSGACSETAPTMPCSTPRSARRSPASPRATISSSIAATTSQHSAGI